MGLNALQANQLAAVLAGNSAAYIPDPNSGQGRRAAFLLDSARGSVAAEAQLKAAKKANKKDGISTAFKVAGSIPGPQQPFVQAGGMVYDTTQGNPVGTSGGGGGAIGSVMGSAGGSQQAPSGQVPITADPLEDAPRQTLEYRHTDDPDYKRIVDKMGAAGRPFAAPMVAGGAALGAIAGALSGPQSTQITNSNAGPMGRHASRNLMAKGIENTKPGDIRSMNPLERQVLLDAASVSGASLTNRQQAAYPRQERRDLIERGYNIQQRPYGNAIKGALMGAVAGYAGARYVQGADGIPVLVGG